MIYLFLTPILNEIAFNEQTKADKNLFVRKKTISKVKRINKALLPIKLIDKLKSIFTPKEMEKAIKVLAIIRKKVIIGKLDDENYIPLCKKYKRKLVGSSEYYKKIFTSMQINDILQKEELENGTSFSTKSHQCCRYRINPEYLKGKLGEITYKTRID